MRRRNWTRTAAVFAPLFALGMAACGGDDGEPAAQPTTTAAAREPPPSPSTWSTKVSR